jgi:hypothetical protein
MAIAVLSNRKLSWIRDEVQRYWVHALQRRGQRQRVSWVYLSDRPWFKLPSARALHPVVGCGSLRKSHLESTVRERCARQTSCAYGRVHRSEASSRPLCPDLISDRDSSQPM